MKKISATVAKEKKRPEPQLKPSEPRFTPSPMGFLYLCDVPIIVSRPGTPESAWVDKWQKP